MQLVTWLFWKVKFAKSKHIVEWRKLPMYSTCFSLHQNWSQYRPQHGQLRLLLKWMFEIGGRGSVHEQNRETRCIRAWNVGSLDLNFYCLFTSRVVYWGFGPRNFQSILPLCLVVGQSPSYYWNYSESFQPFADSSAKHTRLWLGAGIQTFHILYWSAHARTQYR